MSVHWSAEDGWECQQLLLKISWLLDHGGLKDIDECFVAEPTIQLFGNVISGLANVKAVFYERTVDRVTRHANSPSLIDPLPGGDEARARTYVTVYRADQSDDPAPRPLDGPVNFVEYDDTLVREDGVWKVSRRKVSMIFLRS